jgi:hypothetical protein
MKAGAAAIAAIALVCSCTGTAERSAPSSARETGAAPIGTGSPPPSIPVGIGANTFLLHDDLQTDSGWDIFTAQTGEVKYGEGTLMMSFDVVGSIWSDREVGSRWNVLRVEGTVHLENAAGAAGLMCGSGPLDHIGGVVNRDGNWFVVETVDGNTRQLQTGHLQTPNPVGVYHLAVECAGTATGSLRWRMVVDGVPVPVFERATGPADFDRGVAFASIGSVDFVAEFDDVSVYGGSAFTGFPP